MTFKNFILLIGLCCFGSVLSAQKTDKQTHKLIEKAQEKIYNNNFQEAYNIYDELLKMHPEDEIYFNFKKGSCLILMHKNSKQALEYIRRARKAAHSASGTSDIFQYMHPEINYYLGRAFHMTSQFDSAIYYYDQSLAESGEVNDELQEEIDYRTNLAKSAKNIMTTPQTYTVKNVGTKLNSEHEDYKPVISADESVLIFTSRNQNSTGGKIDIDGKYFEDIYISNRDEYGYWKKPKNISDNINTDNHEASVGLSADGRNLIIYKGSDNSGALMMSFLEGSDWGTPIPIDDGKTINSKKSWETSASMTVDQKTIYFTSERKHGNGGLDIYKSEKLDNGNWGEPVNLGPAINTEFDEESPFIHPDGKTLYFASKGHNTMGGFDIFKTVLEGGVWSAPVNMGYPINTVHNDVHFVLTANGKKAYFSSGRDGGQGHEDIYMVTLDEEVRPLVLIKGVVKAASNEVLADVSIDVFDKEGMKKQEYVYKPNSATGKYLMILPPGKSYSMLVAAEGYETYEVNLDIPNQDDFHEFYQEIRLNKVGSEDDSLLTQEITVVNSFDNLRDNTTIDPKLKQADPDYLKDLVYDIVNLSDSGGAPGSEADKMLEEKLNKVDKITDDVADNFDKVVKHKAFTDAYTYRSNYVRDMEMESIVLNDDTVHFIPFDHFVQADLSTGDDLADASNTESDNTKEQSSDTDNIKDVKSDDVDNTSLADNSSNNANNNVDESSTSKDNNTKESQSTGTVNNDSNQGEQAQDDDIAAKEANVEDDADDKTANATTENDQKTDQHSTTSSEVALKNATVYFDFDSYAVQDSYKKGLQALVSGYKKDDSIRLRIEGHTDALGNAEYNKILSKRRANAVVNYLTSLGVSNKRIDIQFYGEDRPAAPNTKPDGSDNKEGRSLNRRAEVKMVR